MLTEDTTAEQWSSLGCPSLSFWASCFLELLHATEFWCNQRRSAILWGVTIINVTGIKLVPCPKFIQVAMVAQLKWAASVLALLCQVLPALTVPLPEGSYQSLLILSFSQQQGGSEKGHPLQGNLIWVGLMSIYGYFENRLNKWVKKVGRYLSILHQNDTFERKTLKHMCFDFHWSYSMGILKILFQWVGSQCSLQSIGLVSLWVGSAHFWSQGAVDSSSEGQQLPPESRNARNEPEWGAMRMFDPPHEAWLCVVLLEISWIQEVSDVI